MKISAIVAMSKNRVIGINGQLPWRLPEDLKWFKKVTTGHPIVMGRKTFESIGRVLPNRENVIVSRNTDYKVAGAHVVPDLEGAIEYCSRVRLNEKLNEQGDESTSQYTESGCSSGNDEIFIIGGMQIYQLALPLLDRIYLTVIHQEYEGDAYFPTYLEKGFSEIFREDHLDAPIPHSFLILERIKV